MEKNRTVIQFNGVSKTYLKERLRYGLLSESIRRWVDAATGRRTRTKNVITALDHASFSIARGETVGIIGPNGAGKSTILKLVSRVTIPDEGYVRVDGRVGALIELGAGLHPELTGRENIYLYGAILGMKRQEISDRFHEIVTFADIDEFLDMPIKRYSSGMYARLGFAVAVNMEPDILLIDEVLAVGDEEFQKRCFAKMKTLKRKGTTIVFVSHNLDWVALMCDRVMFLTHGRIEADGAPRTVIAAYRHRV